MTNSDQTLLSPGEVAFLLRRSPRTVTRWADQGKFGEVVWTDGGQRRYRRSGVEAFQAAQLDSEGVA